MEAVFMKRRLLKERITGCLCLLAIRDILLQLGESLFRKREFTRVIAHRECTDHGDGVCLIDRCETKNPEALVCHDRCAYILIHTVEMEVVAELLKLADILR